MLWYVINADNELVQERRFFVFCFPSAKSRAERTTRNMRWIRKGEKQQQQQRESENREAKTWKTIRVRLSRIINFISTPNETKGKLYTTRHFAPALQLSYINELTTSNPFCTSLISLLLLLCRPSFSHCWCLSISCTHDGWGKEGKKLNLSLTSHFSLRLLSCKINS